MGITTKYDDIYVYDRTLKNSKGVYSIYQISREGKITTLAIINTPVLSIFEHASQLIFSTKNALFSVGVKTKEIFKILSLPQEDDIISIVGDYIHHALYFSTNKAIYRVKNNKIELVNDDFGGILKYDGEGLVIFNLDKNLIVRFKNNILYDIPQNFSTTKATDNTLPLKNLNGQQKIIFSETILLHSTSNEQFQAISGDTLEGEMKDGKIVQGKVIRNGKTVKIFWNKRNH